MKRSIVQVAFAVKDLQKSMEQYWNVWGIGPWEIHRFTPDSIREYTVHGKIIDDFEYLVAVTWVGNLQLELLQPVKGPNVYMDFLQNKGEGIHHVKEKFLDEEIDGVLKEYEAKEIKVIQSGKFDEDVFYYLDTESTLGFILEIGNNGKVRKPDRIYPPDLYNSSIILTEQDAGTFQS